jgi:hypothetical protein
MFVKCLILLLGLISFLIFAGCNSNVQTSTAPSTKSPNITSPGNIPNSATTTPGSTQATPSLSVSTPIYPHTLKKNFPWPSAYINLSIPVLPKPGETADLIINLNFDTQYHPDKIEKVQVWTEFYYANPKGSYSEAKRAILIPPSEVAVMGLTSWEGDMVYNIQSNSKIRLPLEGVWQIKSFFASENYETILDDIIFASLDGYAMDLRNFAGLYNPPSYLRNFGYGAQSALTLSEDKNPIILEADISKPPRVGEEAIITCRIRSLHDVPSFSAKVDAFKRKLDVGMNQVPPDKLLVQGDLSWKGDLKANQPTEFSATIKFPETGEWEVYASGNSSEREAKQMSGFAESIHMNITNDISSYGWETRTK